MERPGEEEQQQDPRLAQMQAQRKQRQQQEEQKRQMEEMKNQMLGSIMTQSARARLNSIAVVKPETAALVENLLIRMAQNGQIHGKVDERELKRLLGQVAQQTKQKTNIKFARRELADDDDDESDGSDSDDDDED
ncbi:hypothetical protein PTSG_07174 [Salpingoeca rosetta]|uniref:Programmed cell death protein 5 n=1 Tax=Salpingoeca rosetta (strain ATCC 50818 / BSB-021) TaxID=946362 RepID=F2UE99_SALR5|nr:uncharacterized protein PTSG_07174 [Salpingoeca rosetta]EGD74949.1 hypothetical protein PTSG_07174 [Salpingoeca rosetta]|eukprot:XP_004992594.1 hypothetical protein PTSG_07174 [Salpingoeca rosetta]